MMDHVCESCGAQFIPGQMGDMIQGRCPDCGGSVFRSQPTPLHSDMEMRNMPDPGGDDTGGNPLQEGFLADNGWQNPMKRDESFASVQSAAGPQGQTIDEFAQGLLSPDEYLDRTNEWNQGLLDKSNGQAPPVEPPPVEPSTGHSLGWEPGTPGRGVFIGDHLHTWPYDPENPKDSLDHFKYVGQHGGTNDDVARSGFSILPRGDVDKTGLITEDVLNRAREVDPRLLGGERPTIANTISMTPYSSWMHQSDADFETENVIPPGPHSVEAYATTGGGNPGLHTASLDDLYPLGVKIDGQDITPQTRREMLDKSRQGPVVLSHDDPKILDLAKSIAEYGTVPPDRHEEHHDVLYPHKTAIDPSGFSDPRIDGVLAGLNFEARNPKTGSWVNYFQHSPTIQAEHPGGPLEVAHHDPRALDALTAYTDGGDINPAIQLQQSRMAKTAISLPNPIDVAKDVGGKALNVGQDAGFIPKNLSPGQLLFHNPMVGMGLAPGNLAIKGIDQATGLHAPSFTDAAQSGSEFLGLTPKSWSPGDLARSGITDAALLATGGLAAPEVFGADAAAAGAAGAAEAGGGEAATAGLASKLPTVSSLGSRGTAEVASQAKTAAPVAAEEGAGAAGAGEAAGGVPQGVTPQGVGGSGALAGAKAKMGKVWNFGKNAYIGNQLLNHNPATQAVQQSMQPPPPAPGAGMVTAPSVGLVAPTPMAPQQPTTTMPYTGKTDIEILADTDWHPSSDPVMHMDPKNRKDGDHSNELYDPTVNGIGGTDEGPEGWDDPDVDQDTVDKHGPKMVIYALMNASSDEDEDPEFKDVVDKLAAKATGDHDLEPFWQEVDNHLGNVIDHASNFLGGGHSPSVQSKQAVMNPGHVPVPPQVPTPGVQIPTNTPDGGKPCPHCGTQNSPEATTCSSCGQGMGASQGLNRQADAGDVLNTFQYNTPQQKVPQPIPQSDYSTAKCPHCGFGMPPGSLVCPQCGQSAMAAAPTPQAQPNVTNQSVPLTASAQVIGDMERTAGAGPETPEQFQATMQILSDQGRDDEASNLIANPDQYGKELAEAQNKQIMAPPGDGQTAAPPAPPQEEAPPEATMPVPGMSQGPPMTAKVAGQHLSEGEEHLLRPGERIHWYDPNNNQEGGYEGPIHPGTVVKPMPDFGVDIELDHPHPEWGKNFTAAASELEKLEQHNPEDYPQDQPSPGYDLGGEAGSYHAHVDNAIMSALEHHSDATGGPDSFAPRCPNCHSGSTGIVTEDGDLRCHACGHQWKKDLSKDITSSFTYISDNARPFPNPTKLPAADQKHPHDPANDQNTSPDSSLTWQDINGDPLHGGEQYEMTIPGVQIPDVVTIEGPPKPDSISYLLTGEYGISHKTELTKEEAELEGITFSPIDNFQASDGGPDDLDQNMDSKQVPGPGDQTDLSTPHVMMTHRKQAWEEGTPLPERRKVQIDPYTDSPANDLPLCETCGGSGEGQYGGICDDCLGTGSWDRPKNPELLAKPDGSFNGLGVSAKRKQAIHPEDPQYPEWDRDQAKELALGEEAAGNPAGHVDPEDREYFQKLIESGSTPAEAYNIIDEAKAEHSAWWLRQDVSPWGDRAISYSKTAGKHYTHPQQRDFIDEQGTARNLDKLVLEGTHYLEDDEDSLGDSILFL